MLSKIHFQKFHGVLCPFLFDQAVYIQGVLKMARNIYVTRIYVEYQTKNSNLNLVNNNNNNN
jgi:hypothetical protein